MHSWIPVVGCILLKRTKHNRQHRLCAQTNSDGSVSSVELSNLLSKCHIRTSCALR
jgi:hypothetical protein